MTTIRIHKASTLLSRNTIVEIGAWKHKRELIRDDDDNNNNNKVYLYLELHNTHNCEGDRSLAVAVVRQEQTTQHRLEYNWSTYQTDSSPPPANKQQQCQHFNKSSYMNDTEVDEAQQVSTTYSLRASHKA